MNSAPFFSICIPNYNYSRFLKLTIESILSQSVQDFEIIIADNASTDDSVEMLKLFQEKRINIIQNRVNIGFSPNLDRCTEVAKGKYMILLSSDDIMLPDALEKYQQIILKSENPELIIMSACSIIDAEGNKIGEKAPMTGDVKAYINKNSIKPIKEKSEFQATYYQSKEIIRAVLTGTFQPAGQFLTTCYSSSLYKRLCGYRSIMALYPDAHFSQRLLFENPDVIYVDQCLFGYRIHQANNFTAIISLQNIKHLTDCYLLSKQYDKQQLAQVGLVPEDLEIAFVNNIIFKGVFWALLRGNIMKGVRLMAFGVASYPQRVIWNLKFPFLNLMVFFSPFLGLFYKLKVKK